MASQAETSVREALAGFAERMVGYHGQRLEYAVVEAAKPRLVVELAEGHESLVEDESLVLPRELRQEARDLKRDDSVVVALMPDGRYVVTSLVSDTDAPDRATAADLEGKADASDVTALAGDVTAVEGDVAALDGRVTTLENAPPRTFGPYRASFNVPAGGTQDVDVAVDPVAIAGDDDQFIISGDVSSTTRTGNDGSSRYITWGSFILNASTLRITFKNHLTTNNPIGALRFKIERFD